MTELTILQINDTHSYLELHKEHVYTEKGLEAVDAGGYARLMTLIEEIRQQNPNVILLDNGDTIHGTYDAVKSKGENMVPVLQHMGFDAMTFHWDAAYTPTHLKKLDEQLSYPILAINCYKKGTTELFFEPYLMKQVGDLKVAIIGIAANFIDKTMPAVFSEGVYFTMGDEELPGYIKKVKGEGADIVLLLSHNGFPQDIKMLSEIPGIDICLSGHTHNRLDEIVKVKNSYIIQSGSHGSFMGRIDLGWEKGKGLSKINHQLIFVDKDIKEDPAMKKLVDAALAPNRELLSQQVGCTEELLHRGTSISAPMDNLLLQSMLHATGAQIAFSNGWRYGAPIAQGPITLEELYHIVPMDPPLVTATLTGGEIWEMIEDNLQNTYAEDPYKQMGGYVKRTLGLKVYMKIENPAELRVQQIFVGDAPLDKEKTYKVVYVTRQAVPKDKFGKDHKELEIHAIEALKGYLASLNGSCFVNDYPESYVVV